MMTFKEFREKIIWRLRKKGITYTDGTRVQRLVGNSIICIGYLSIPFIMIRIIVKKAFNKD